MINWTLKCVRYNWGVRFSRVFVNNGVRYNRVFVNNRVRYDWVSLYLKQVIGCCISTLVVNKAGRKFLLCLSLAICCLSMAGLGTTTYFTCHGISAAVDGILRWFSLACLIVFVLGFTLGLGPVPWILVGELIPGTSKSDIQFTVRQDKTTILRFKNTLLSSFILMDLNILWVD
jgi:hypothetical protein